MKHPDFDLEFKPEIARFDWDQTSDCLEFCYLPKGFDRLFDLVGIPAFENLLIDRFTPNKNKWGLEYSEKLFNFLKNFNFSPNNSILPEVAQFQGQENGFILLDLENHPNYKGLYDNNIAYSLFDLYLKHDGKHYVHINSNTEHSVQNYLQDNSSGFNPYNFVILSYDKPLVGVTSTDLGLQNNYHKSYQAYMPLTYLSSSFDLELVRDNLTGEVTDPNWVKVGTELEGFTFSNRLDWTKPLIATFEKGLFRYCYLAKTFSTNPLQEGCTAITKVAGNLTFNDYFDLDLVELFQRHNYLDGGANLVRGVFCSNSLVVEKYDQEALSWGEYLPTFSQDSKFILFSDIDSYFNLVKTSLLTFFEDRLNAIPEEKRILKNTYFEEVVDLDFDGKSIFDYAQFRFLRNLFPLQSTFDEISVNHLKQVTIEHSGETELTSTLLSVDFAGFEFLPNYKTYSQDCLNQCALWYANNNFWLEDFTLIDKSPIKTFWDIASPLNLLKGFLINAKNLTSSLKSSDLSSIFGYHQNTFPQTGFQYWDFLGTDDQGNPLYGFIDFEVNNQRDLAKSNLALDFQAFSPLWDFFHLSLSRQFFNFNSFEFYPFTFEPEHNLILWTSVDYSLVTFQISFDNIEQVTNFTIPKNNLFNGVFYPAFYVWHTKNQTDILLKLQASKFSVRTYRENTPLSTSLSPENYIFLGNDYDSDLQESIVTVQTEELYEPVNNSVISSSREVLINNSFNLNLNIPVLQNNLTFNYSSLLDYPLINTKEEFELYLVQKRDEFIIEDSNNY